MKFTVLSSPLSPCSLFSNIEPADKYCSEKLQFWFCPNLSVLFLNLIQILWLSLSLLERNWLSQPRVCLEEDVFLKNVPYDTNIIFPSSSFVDGNHFQELFSYFHIAIAGPEKYWNLHQVLSIGTFVKCTWNAADISCSCSRRFSLLVILSAAAFHNSQVSRNTFTCPGQTFSAVLSCISLTKVWNK